MSLVALSPSPSPFCRRHRSALAPLLVALPALVASTSAEAAPPHASSASSSGSRADTSTPGSRSRAKLNPTKKASRPKGGKKAAAESAEPKPADGDGEQDADGSGGDSPAGVATSSRADTSSGKLTFSTGSPARDEGALPTTTTQPGDPLSDRVRLTVGAGLIGRSFDYRDPLSPNLRSYSVPAATLVSVSAVAMPFGGEAPGSARVGVAGSYARSLGMVSAVPDGSTAVTNYDRWEAGIRVERAPAPASRLGVVGLFASYSVTRFLFADETVGTLLPETGYGSAALSGDVAFRLPGCEFGLLAAVGAVPQTGVAGRRFPQAKGGVARAGATLTVPFSRRIAARLSGHYERFFLSLNPEPGDRFVAGGALDQYLRGGLDLLVGL
jgi:hypothetical protein